MRKVFSECRRRNIKKGEYNSVEEALRCLKKKQAVYLQRVRTDRGCSIKTSGDGPETVNFFQREREKVDFSYLQLLLLHQHAEDEESGRVGKGRKGRVEANRS